MGQITTSDLEIVITAGHEPPFIYIVHARKDGGAMGFDENHVVAATLDEQTAIQIRDDFVKARTDFRWWPTIIAYQNAK